MIYSLLPNDSVLLPLSDGKLLVSPDFAIFCRIAPENVTQLTDAILKKTGENELPKNLVNDLKRHGFGQAPQKPEPMSPSVQIQLTNECNLKCSYCCTNSGIPRKKELTYEQLIEVIDKVRDDFGPRGSKHNR